MSLSCFGLPPAVIRMKARREEREARDFALRVYQKVMHKRAEDFADDRTSDPPAWVSEFIQ